jgi:hypothetical protein
MQIEKDEKMEPIFDSPRDVLFEYADQLPFFDNLYAAQAHYYNQRKEQLLHLEEICREVNLPLDYSPDSLIYLEALYFQFFQTNRFYDFQLSIEEFEQLISVYLCEIVIQKNSGNAEWFVEEYSHVDHKYTMGIRYGRYHLHFQNLFPHHYLSHQDASGQTFYKRFLRMNKHCK